MLNKHSWEGGREEGKEDVSLLFLYTTVNTMILSFFCFFKMVFDMKFLCAQIDLFFSGFYHQCCAYDSFSQSHGHIFTLFF